MKSNMHVAPQARRSLGRCGLILSAVLGAVGAISTPTRAAMILNVGQVGSDVVMKASGTVNTAGLSSLGTAGNNVGVQPFVSFIMVGGTTSTTYQTISGPANIGAGTAWIQPTSYSGDTFGIFEYMNRMVVPANYVSGTPILGTATFANHTIADLGMSEGQYVYTWGSGPSADSLTINIPGAVPEPTTAALAALSLTGLLARKRTRPTR